MTTSFTLQSSADYPVAIWMDPASPAYVGCRSETPFTLYLSAEDLNPHRVDLYAQNSQSAPYQQPQNKWSHLVPQWRFTDINGNLIESITPTASTIVTNLSGETIGMTASAQFYYIDDKPTIPCEPIIIWAIVDYSEYPVYLDEDVQANVPGFSNSRVGMAVSYPIYNIEPTHFEITRNGEDRMLPLYWKDTTIPYMITVNGSVSASIPTLSTSDCFPILFGIPTTNEYGISGGPIERSLIPELSSAVMSPSTLYLSAFDAQGYPIGGYARSAITTNESATAAYLSAIGTVFWEDYVFAVPELWVSNPLGTTLNKMSVPCVDPTLLEEVVAYLHPEQYIPADSDANSTIYDINYLQVTATDVMGLTGFGGIYGLAIDGDKNLWTSDGENDKAYKFDTDASLLVTVDFASGSTPAGISVDGNNDVWVALFDAVSAVKLDGSTGATLATVEYPYTPIVGTDPVFKPTLAETDKNNDIWVSYNNTVSSALHKFSSTGTYITQIDFPSGANPMDIVIDSNNDIWVTLQYSSYATGLVEKYSGTTYNVLSSFMCETPSYITIGFDDTIYYTAGWNTVTEITSSSNTRTTNVGTPYSEEIYVDEDYGALEGISFDLYGRLWVIESIKNQLYQISLNNFVGVPVDYINPINKYTVYNTGGIIYTEPDITAKSAQAFGDWTGFQWETKFGIATAIDILETVTLSAQLTGISAPFVIANYEGYEYRKFNESWDAAPEIRTYAIAPHINGNEVLWGDYMGATWGTKATPYAVAFGRASYEKIANFAQNKVDIETCEIPDIYSLADETDVPIDDYNFNYPTDLQRLMNLVAINQQVIWGSRCKCDQNITNDYALVASGGQMVPVDRHCIRCGHSHPGNRGVLFDPLNYEVSATVPFIVQDKYLEQGSSIVFPPLSCTGTTCVSTYSLEDSYDWLLPNVYDIVNVGNDFEKTAARFYFFNYLDGFCDEQLEGVINWEDEYTTIEESVSSLSAWYGPNGTVDKMLNYTLHKGLGLIEEDNGENSQ